MIRKLISLMLAFMLLCGLCVAAAEDDTEVQPRILTYQGGVVLRTVPRGTADSDLIQLAYSLTDMPYIVLNETYEWEIYIEGGTAPYEVIALLAWKESADAERWSTAAYYSPADFRVAHTFTDEGLYFWQIEVTDSEGQSLLFQTRQYETYTEEDETDVMTTAGKVNSIVSTLITADMSDYSRAKVLHDWLIYNANYDTTYTYYDASGVLLHGRGVCESYGRAYMMLCTAAGLECMYVSGFAGDGPDPDTWGSHGWNLVKLNGSWYHIDCTWDDPVDSAGNGGYECHTYFCVDDETMAKDHRWNQPDDLLPNNGMLVPDAEGGIFESLESSDHQYAFTFTSYDEFREKYLQMADAGERRGCVAGLYVGDADFTEEIVPALGEFANSLATELVQTGKASGWYSYEYSFSGMIYFYATWNDPTGYLSIAETSVFLSVGEETTISVADCYPQDNSYSWSSSDSAVAAASSAYDAANGVLLVTICGKNEGTATITGTTTDGHSDSVTVHVLGAHKPEIALHFNESSDGVTVSWSGVPGATEYDLVKRTGSGDVILVTTTGTNAFLTNTQLSSDVQNEVYVEARRVVAGDDIAAYQSEIYTYGTLKIVYAAYLPGNTLAIEAEAFMNDARLTTVYMPDGLLSIGSKAFSGCFSLTAIRIPDSVTSIGTNAFQGCPLTYVTLTPGSYADSWVQMNISGVTVIYE